MNPISYFSPSGIPTHLIQRVNPMLAIQAQAAQAAQAQSQSNLNGAYLNHSLGFPAIVANANMNNMTNIHNRIPAQMPYALARPQFYQPKQSPNQGKGILRIMLFSDYLSAENHARKDIDYWKRLVLEFFADEGMMRYTLWNSRTFEQRSFDIVNSVIARYYQVNYDSGVSAIHLVLGHAREQISPGPSGFPAIHIVDCPRASMIYDYENGTRIVSAGHLRVRMNSDLRIEFMDFNTKKHTEYVPRSSSDALPQSPINDYGIPMKTLRSLEIAEGVVQLNELINSTLTSQQGPMQALHTLATKTNLNIISLQHMTPPTPGPSPPNEPLPKTPLKNEEIPMDPVSNNQNIHDGAITSSPLISNVKNEIMTPKLSTKSPRMTTKRNSDSPIQSKQKRRATKQSSPKKGAREDSTS